MTVYQVCHRQGCPLITRCIAVIPKKSPKESPHCSKDRAGTAGRIYKMCIKMQIRSQRDFSRQFIKPGCESPVEAKGSKAWNLSKVLLINPALSIST